MRVRPFLVGALGAATVLALVAPVPAAGATPQLKGRVTDTNKDGVPGICVDVHPAGSLAARATYVTDADGRWTASPSVDQPGVFGSGRYRVQVGFRDCDGTTNGSLAGQWWERVVSFTDATEVVVTPGADAPLELNSRLDPGGAVSGRVVDQDGAAISGSCVTVTSEDDATVGNSATSAGNGSFTVVGLPPGTYLVRARDCTSPFSQAPAHLGAGGAVARGAEDAARFAVRAGRVTGVGPLTLPDAGTIRGVIRGSGGAVAEACVSAVDAGSDTTAGDVTGADGAYRIGGLLPGQWLLRVTDCLEDDLAHRFATAYLLPDGTTTTDPAVAARSPFTVGGGTTTVGDRSVTAGGAVAGRVRADADTTGLRPGAADGAVPKACVSAVPRGSLRIAGSAVADTTGHWVIGGLDPGTAYHFAAYDCDDDNSHGLDWATASPAEGQAASLQPTANTTRVGVDIVVGDFVRRVAGQDRVATAVQLALDTFTSADTVILARADAYPDALAGAPLATLLDAPILLTSPTTLSPGVASAIRGLGADRVVLLGLEAALSPAVQAQVEGIDGVSDVRRVGGRTRFETAAMIAGFVGGGQAYVVEGSSPDPNRGWPDAVSVAGLAARTAAPLLLVERDSIPDGTRTALAGLGFSRITTIGGPVAVSDAVQSQLATYTDQLDRLAGSTRYGTSAAVVERALELGLWSRTVWLATGQNYPDALVTGAIIGQDGGLLQLVAGSDATSSPEALDVLDELSVGIERAVLLGGTAAISTASGDAIEAALGVG